MNMHININDKFVTVKKMWFIDEGTEITVTDVGVDGIISFVFGENNSSTGYMDIETFNEHFEKVEEEKVSAEIPTITAEYIEEIMENSEFEINTVFNKCTVVSCRLPNGFVITESSACVSPEKYDENIGVDICLDKIADKIWELEAYRLQQWMWEEGMIDIAAEDCPYGCDDCANCPCDGEGCEIDECLNTDLDCDDCDDHTCQHNNN